LIMPIGTKNMFATEFSKPTATNVKIGIHILITRETTVRDKNAVYTPMQMSQLQPMALTKTVLALGTRTLSLANTMVPFKYGSAERM
jgi:hypothetical protein